MAPNTNTLTAEPRNTAPEKRPPKAGRGAVTWVAVIAACLVVVAFAVAAVVMSKDGSGTPATQLDPQAEQYERQAHLDGQARTHGGGGSAVTPGEATSQYARYLEAERYERQAHLDGQATLHGQRPVEAPAPTDEADTPEPEFLPGSRHVPTR